MLPCCMLALLATPLATKAWERGKVETFATLPARVRRIPRGSPWTARATSTSSRWRRTSPGRARERSFVFDPQGKHLRTVAIKGSSRLLLDIGFHPQTGQVAGGRLQGRQGPERRSQDGRLIRVHDGHGQEPRPRRDDVRRRRQRVRDRRPPGHHLESRTRRRRSVGMGHEPAAEADAATARHRRQWSGVQQQEDGTVRRQHGERHHRQDTGDRARRSSPARPKSSSTASAAGPTACIIDEHDNLWVACNQSNEILVLEPTHGPGDRQARRLRRHRSRRGTHRLSLVEQPSSSTVTTCLSPTCRSISAAVHSAAC